MTQPPPPPGYEDPEAPEGYENVVPTSASKANIPSTWDALMSYMKGAGSLVTGPAQAAQGVYRGMDDPDVMQLQTPGSGPVGGLLRMLASLGKIGKAGAEREKADVASVTSPETAEVVSLLSKLIPGAQMAPGMAMQGLDVGGAGAQLAGADFEPPQAMRMSQAIKSGDIAGFMEMLGSTTAQTGALGLTGTPTKLGKALGMGKAAAKSSGGAGAASGRIADPTLDTSGITSPILRKNVFPGGPPARTMPVPTLDVPVTAGELSGSAALKMGEKALESSLPAAGSFEKLHSARAQAIYDYGKTVGQYISKDMKTAEGSGPAVSLRVQNRIAEAKQVMGENANKLYDQVWSHPSLSTTKGAPRKFSVKGTPIETLADDLIPQLEAVEARIGNQGGGTALNTLRSFKTPEGKWATLSELQALKQAAFNSGETARLGLNSGSAKRLSAAIDDTIRMKLDEAGGKGLVSRWEVAKRKWTELKQLDDDKFINGILANNKDAAYDIIKGGGIADVDTVWKLLKPSDKQAVKARWVMDVVENAGDQPAGSFKQLLLEASGFEGKAGTFQAPQGKLAVSPSKAQAGLSKIGGEKFQRLFTGDERAAINTWAEAVDRYGKGSVRSINGAILNASLYYGLMRGLSGDYSALAKTAALGGGAKLMGYIVTNPKTARIAASYLDALGRAGEAPFSNPSVSFWGQRLAKDVEELVEDEREKGTLK